MRRYHAGFTLVELLLCLAVAAFLLTHLALPGLAARRERLDIDALMRDVQDSLALARHAAIRENSITTLCRSDDGTRCQGTWMDGLVVFTDSNANHVLDPEDRLLYRLEASRLPGTLLFRAFGNRQYLQFDGRGLTRYQNGNFTYCPANGEARLIRQLILSFSGRTRMAIDQDGDGIVENSQGKAVDCPN